MLEARRGWTPARGREGRLSFVSIRSGYLSTAEDNSPQNTDQFYAVGLVGYGFGCKDPIPAVYTNLAEPSIKSFIASAFENPNFC